MPHTTLVNPQSPTRTIAAQPFRRRFYRARRNEVISITVLIGVFVEGGQNHPLTQVYKIPGVVNAGILVGETEKFAK
ncbi:MAG TPA: hypothetical protein VGF61_23380 [Candidatus Acidoferrum sp.]|jgi:hypothetical protein